VHPPLRLPTPIRPSVWLMALSGAAVRNGTAPVGEGRGRGLNCPHTSFNSLSTAPRRLFSSIRDTTLQGNGDVQGSITRQELSTNCLTAIFEHPKCGSVKEIAVTPAEIPDVGTTWHVYILD
jgi:hypothetical protein